MLMDFYLDLDCIDWEELLEYQVGFIIELKSRPGVFDTIASYDPAMVPPIWLLNDPIPRYPHELKIISRATNKLVTPIQCKLPRSDNEVNEIVYLQLKDHCISAALSA
jgi:hypothetical protein